VSEQQAASAASIGAKAGRGLAWSLAAATVAKAGSFAMGLVLARLLSPEDFGLYAVALAAAAFLMHVNDVGIITGVIQWREKLDDAIPTATTLALGFSVLAYAAFWFAAPGFATLAGAPAATSVLRLLTLVIVIDGVTAVRIAVLQRDFRQQKIAIGNFIGLIAQVPVSILLAAYGWGPLSFALGQLAHDLVAAVLFLCWARLPISFGFDRTVARKLVRFGAPLAAGLGIEALLMNADYVIVGQLLGAALLGYYLLAFNVSSWVANILGTAIRYVSVAGFSRLAEREGELQTGLRRSIAALLAAVLPVAAILGVLAVPLIVFLYGERWAPAAAALTYLMILSVFRLVIGIGLDALMATGATWAALVVHGVWAAALLPALYIGTTLFGIRGTAVAHVLVAAAVAIPAMAIALRRVGVLISPIARGALRPLISATAAGAAAWIVVAVSVPRPFVELVTAGGLGLLVYVVTAFPASEIRRAYRQVQRRIRQS